MREKPMNAFVRGSAPLGGADDLALPPRVRLSERDSQRVLALLENPPEPNARLMEVLAVLPRESA
jgi:uncharacterized protein (DUF1778 family)